MTQTSLPSQMERISLIYTKKSTNLPLYFEIRIKFCWPTLFAAQEVSFFAVNRFTLTAKENIFATGRSLFS